jgi:broad specificity phosphatase PhoE
MGTLYLVRHGQASFGAADYDQLSELGRRQCERLGQWFAAHRTVFDVVISGSLKRQRQSLAGIEAGLQRTHGNALTMPGLNEYDSEALVRTVHSGPLAAPTTPELARFHFRLLRRGLLAWMAGSTQPQGMPSHADFVAGVRGALDHVRAHHAGGTALIVSSGGPISMAIGHVLGLVPEAVIELNLQLRNSAVCELKVSPKRHTLISFNTLPHLNGPEHASWVTHA